MEEAKKLALIREELKVLQNTKSSLAADGKKHPLGVVISYRVTLCGFSDHPARIFWSMFDTKQPPKLPYLWDFQRMANTVISHASGCEDFAPSFWVPLPAITGRFTIALSVFDDKGVSRFRTSSRPFAS
ncbi:MAG: hypothetical protein ACJ76S_08435 [Solirubrobacteraceae bacterium]